MTKVVPIVKNIQIAIDNIPPNYSLSKIYNFLSEYGNLLSIIRTQTGIKATLTIDTKETDFISKINSRKLDDITIEAVILYENNTKPVFSYPRVPMIFQYSNVPIPLEPSDMKKISESNLRNSRDNDSDDYDSINAGRYNDRDYYSDEGDNRDYYSDSDPNYKKHSHERHHRHSGRRRDYEREKDYERRK